MTEKFDQASHSVVNDELVHSSWPKGCSDSVNDGSTGIDIGDDLLLALSILGTFLQQQNLGLHSGGSIQFWKRTNFSQSRRLISIVSCLSHDYRRYNSLIIGLIHPSIVYIAVTGKELKISLLFLQLQILLEHSAHAGAEHAQFGLHCLDC